MAPGARPDKRPYVSPLDLEWEQLLDALSAAAAAASERAGRLLREAIEEEQAAKPAGREPGNVFWRLACRPHLDDVLG